VKKGRMTVAWGRVKGGGKENSTGRKTRRQDMEGDREEEGARGKGDRAGTTIK